MEENALAKIQEIVPFEIVSHRVLNDGWANFVIEINDEWIFRFSRGELTKSQMALENAFLPGFSSVSPIRIPNIEFSGQGFMGYKKMNGIPLKAEIVKGLSDNDRKQVAQELGAFLSSLHGYKFSHPNLQEFPYGGGDFWNEVWPAVEPLLSEVVRRNARTYFESAFAHIEARSFAKTIAHADLGTTNVLFDVENNKLAGIIDFGDMCLHDPARDFNGLLRNHGRAFTEKVLEYYDRKIEANFWDRIEFYSKKQSFQVIYYAPKFGFQEYVPHYVADIETQFSA